MGRRGRLLIARASAALVASGFALLHGAAHADPDPAAAQVLFDEGKRLMAAGNWSEACPKLEESLKLDEGIGTKFQLATCDERLGRTATAWALFLEAAQDARRNHQDARERVARERAAALEPLLSRLTVTAPSADQTHGLEVKRDGKNIGPAEWGMGLPADPGEHTIVASAPGKRDWSKTVVVPATAAARVSVEVPSLEDLAPPVVLPPPTVVSPPPAAPVARVEPVVPAPRIDVGALPPARSSGTGQRVIGGVLFGLGFASLATGAVFAVQSKQNHDDSSAHCAGNVCDATGVAERQDAIRYGNVATVTLAAGAGAMLGGMIVWLTAPSGAREGATRALTVSPMVGGGTTGLSVRGSM